MSPQPAAEATSEEIAAPSAAPSSASLTSFLPSTGSVNDISWLDFIALGGDEGKLWVECFSSGEPLRLSTEIGQALALLRRGDVAGGGHRLDEVERTVAHLEVARPSIRLVLERLHLATAAYLHYRLADLERADRCMVEAAERIRQAIELDPSLPTLAYHHPELLMQRARIARNRRRWAEMKRHLDVALAMLENRCPFCVLNDGRAIGQADLVSHLTRGAALHSDKGKRLLAMIERQNGGQRFRAIMASLYALPGWLLEYP